LLRLAALRVGLTQDQIREICFHQTFYIGTQNARRAKMLAEEVFLAN
jgi:alkylhydroperoxidase/carboxymuconolactone decarboxylase family protein YurZ